MAEIGSAGLVRLVVLVALGLAYRAWTSRAQADRLRASGTPPAHLSVWAVAAALTLPVGWVALVVLAVLAVELWARRPRNSNDHYRIVRSGAAVGLATVASALAADRLGIEPGGRSGPVAVLLVIGIYAVVRFGVLLAGVAPAARPVGRARVTPSRDVIVQEGCAILLGVVTAEFLEHSLWLSPIVLGVLAAVDRGSTVTQLRVAAATDPKTGLLNAVTWRERAGLVLSAAARRNGSLALAVIDLDHFKAVNDTFGHLAGDDVLIAVAATLRREMREHDTLGRFGGEEFVVLLADVDQASAAIVAERLRARVAALSIPGGVQVSASIGVAVTARAGGIRLDQLLQAADHALYGAKAAGRDCVRTTVVTPAGSDADRGRATP